jgi:hypothetical protein
MPAAPVNQVGQQLRREQLVTVVGKEGVHRPGRDQVATPGCCVQPVIGWVGIGGCLRRHAPRLVVGLAKARRRSGTRRRGSSG